MFCKNCGQDVGDKKFCPNCGTRVEGADSAPESAPAPAPAGQNYNPQPNGMPPERMVNKIAYGLLAIFLGWLGVHRFYAGKTISGVVYLVVLIFTLGLAAIITGPLSLIEGIVALTRPDDGQGNIPVYPDRYFV